MPGNKIGGAKTKLAMLAKYGGDHNKLRIWHQTIGAIGGRNSRNGGFASVLVGADGLTGPERACIAGKKGGAKSTRKGIKNGERKRSKLNVQA